MSRWAIEDLPWETFDRSKVDPYILNVVKAAAMVERNAADYTTYLGNVFSGDEDFCQYAASWRLEEEQHGEVLGRWAELADPEFDYRAAFKRFTEGFRIQVDAQESIRGSLTGELIARCIVETGTSSFYSALRDACDEPVLKEICHRIAGDEFRHYKYFLDTMRAYQRKEQIPAWKRLWVAIGRIRESEDDELAYAYHASNDWTKPYRRDEASLNYSARAFSFYREKHVERGANMVMKAAGLDPQGWFGRMFVRLLWNYIHGRAQKMSEALRRSQAVAA